VQGVDRDKDTYREIFTGSYGYGMQYEPMVADLKGCVAIVTGATGMIGGAAASILAKSGARVALWGRNDEAGKRKESEIAGLGGEARYYRVDIADSVAMETAVTQVYDDFGRIDILFANAGANSTNRKPATEMDEGLFDRDIDVNLIGGTICLTRLVLPYMIKQGGGNIVYTTSVCGVTGLRNQCGFVASKFAVSALTRSLALEYGRYNIRVNAIAPGSLPDPDAGLNPLWKTCSFDDYDSNFADPGTMVFDIAARRPAYPTDMAGLVLYFVSDDACYTTGQVVSVDGGWTAGLSGDY